MKKNLIKRMKEDLVFYQKRYNNLVSENNCSEPLKQYFLGKMSILNEYIEILEK